MPTPTREIRKEGSCDSSAMYPSPSSAFLVRPRRPLTCTPPTSRGSRIATPSRSFGSARKRRVDAHDGPLMPSPIAVIYDRSPRNLFAESSSTPPKNIEMKISTLSPQAKELGHDNDLSMKSLSLRSPKARSVIINTDHTIGSSPSQLVRMMVSPPSMSRSLMISKIKSRPKEALSDVSTTLFLPSSAAMKNNSPSSRQVPLKILSKKSSQSIPSHEIFSSPKTPRYHNSPKTPRYHNAEQAGQHLRFTPPRSCSYSHDESKYESPKVFTPNSASPSRRMNFSLSPKTPLPKRSPITPRSQHRPNLILRDVEDDGMALKMIVDNKDCGDDKGSVVGQKHKLECIMRPQNLRSHPSNDAFEMEIKEKEKNQASFPVKHAKFESSNSLAFSLDDCNSLNSNSENYLSTDQKQKSTRCEPPSSVLLVSCSEATPLRSNRLNGVNCNGRQVLRDTVACSEREDNVRLKCSSSYFPHSSLHSFFDDETKENDEHGSVYSNLSDATDEDDFFLSTPSLFARGQTEDMAKYRRCSRDQTVCRNNDKKERTFEFSADQFRSGKKSPLDSRFFKDTDSSSVGSKKFGNLKGFDSSFSSINSNAIVTASGTSTASSSTNSITDESFQYKNFRRGRSELSLGSLGLVIEEAINNGEVAVRDLRTPPAVYNSKSNLPSQRAFSPPLLHARGITPPSPMDISNIDKSRGKRLTPILGN
eukprot:CAMPEP_0194449614 /NCGR_PEP_ID=MMETSP0176-20130528/130252_1 /TAXON_ID=216777 /ORGANISM="Proboscia alata, Strain PI-D3" /LENGTH=704 /DNA_ID=CAMNT_0039276777 /DNA_START=32 /DNA_END=2146 /DNA_ORIENTATION=+